MQKKIRVSKKINKDYSVLINELSEINGIYFHNKSIKKIYLKEVSNWDKRLIGNTFEISTLIFKSPITGDPLFGKRFFVNKKNIQEKTNLIERKNSNYYICLAYESFEKFLRSITARVIINNKKKAEEINERLGFNSYKSCLLYLQKEFRNNNDIISILRKLNKDLDNAFENDKGLKNFLHFYRVYTKCRNHIIHSNEIIDLKSLVNANSIDKDFANDYFGIRQIDKTSKYIIDVSNTGSKILKTISSFAYLLIVSFDSSFIK